VITGAPLPPNQPPRHGASLQAAVPPAAQRLLWRTFIRCGWVLVLATSVGVALLGAVVTPLMGMVVFAPCLGALVGGVVALLEPDVRRERYAHPALVYAIATGTMLVPFANGLVGLGTAGGVILIGLLVLVPLLAADRMDATAGTAAVRDVGALAELLPALRTSRLLDEWEATDDLLRSRRHRAIAVEVRGLLLDELSRRDPEGVAAWLAAGDVSPHDHVRSDGDQAG
jgi:hypothetical protein